MEALERDERLVAPRCRGQTERTRSPVSVYMRVPPQWSQLMALGAPSDKGSGRVRWVWLHTQKSK